MTSRFASLTEQDITKIVEGEDSQNTKRSMKVAKHLFADYMKVKKIERNAEVLHNKITCQVQTLEKIGSNLKTLDEMILDVECSQVQFGDEVVNELKKKIDELSSGRLTEEDQDRILKEIQETIKSEVEQLVVNVKAL
ncbi:charged multivesicular body protein 6-A-like isoform X2 [Acropora millepora]|uniref:charged multivesicular body protein 6-A-like isoform X2 n=1 Tax=Acropora millepora TaxID=45264 RepID=UPI0010FCD8AC|nr:charged multivesicular body protein 6-A-like isoform X2 [Acropora millepora]